MLRSFIQQSPIYPAARKMYRSLFESDQVVDAQRMGAFYAQFFQPGETVFDVGANQGEYRFRPIDGRDFRFCAPGWLSAAEACAWLEARMLEDGEYGDMFAHRWPS